MRPPEIWIFRHWDKFTIFFPEFQEDKQKPGPQGGQLSRAQICVVVFALRRSVSFYGSLANGMYRIPGHCEPVTDVTGVAISRIVPFLVDKFRETAG